MLIKILAVIFIGIGIFFWWSCITPVDSDNQDTMTVVIEEGSGRRDIAKQLKQENLIRSELVFSLYSFFSNSLKAGEYELSSSMSIRDIIGVLSDGGENTEEVRVVIPEGLNIDEIDAILTESKVLQEGEFKNELKDENGADLSTSQAFEEYGDRFAFLQTINSPTLEGFLFPDTYNFFIDTTPQDVVEKMLHNYQQKTESLLESIEPSEVLSIMTKASLIQGEVQTKRDMKLVAGIIENRLRINMPLELDITLVYITGNRDVKPTDKNIRSEYNTYRNRGIPPSPINNPGLDAIEAVLEPIPSEYYFYLSAQDGTTHFSKTLEQHNKNIDKYLRQ